jgi:DNA-binding beta-propeller fold protein YncE
MLTLLSLWSLFAAADLRTGYVLVANQQSASASLIDLSSGTARVIAVGNGPHEAVISPSGRTGLVTIYGAGQPGNQLAVVDIKTAAVTRTISLDKYARPHGAMFMPGDETRAVVTSESTQNIVMVNLAQGSIERVIPTGAAGSHMVAITADGSRAFTSDIGAGAVSEMDLKAGGIRSWLTLASPVFSGCTPRPSPSPLQYFPARCPTHAGSSSPPPPDPLPSPVPDAG